MELWFSEKHSDSVKLSIKVNSLLYTGQSNFQRIDVFDSPEFGRFLTLDGYMMFTEKDEFIYHEMITHIPMAVHPSPKNILLIGAGDGGAARELARYPQVENIDVAEIDEDVVKVCKEYLPQTACGFDDVRVHLYFEDGIRFIRRAKDKYDLIITVDSPDLESLGKLFEENTDFFYNTPIINIDHSSDNENYGQINHVDLTASSTAELIFNMFEEYDMKMINEDIATCLLTGIFTATDSDIAVRCRFDDCDHAIFCVPQFFRLCGSAGIRFSEWIC